ncbi:Uncharacterised protein [Vibrio cholerae]|nr:Uncharacterised protein [Vibrio cholerae]CSI92916.1 Uncharacterised protein [Vibrio cholerae]
MAKIIRWHQLIAMKTPQKVTILHTIRQLSHKQCDLPQLI